jgi:hypothetical protein
MLIKTHVPHVWSHVDRFSKEDLGWHPNEYLYARYEAYYKYYSVVMKQVIGASS